MEIITITIRPDAGSNLEYSSGVTPAMGMQFCDAARGKFLELWMVEQKRQRDQEVARLVKEALELKAQGAPREVDE